MKYILIAFLFCLSTPLLSQSISNGFGVCYVTGDPNAIVSINAGQSPNRCKIAYDTALDKFWFYDETREAWFKFETLAQEAVAGGTVGTLTKTSPGTYKYSVTGLPSTYIFATDSSATNEIELPVQTGHARKYLKTDGSSTSWARIDSLQAITSNITYNTTSNRLPTTIVADSGGGNLTITLPSSEDNAKSVMIHKISDTNKITISGAFFGGITSYDFWSIVSFKITYDLLSNKWFLSW